MCKTCARRKIGLSIYPIFENLLERILLFIRSFFLPFLLRFDTERNIVEAKIRGQETRAVYFSNYLRIVLNLIRRNTMDLMEKSVYIFP